MALSMARKCIDSLVKSLQSIAELNGKSFLLLTEDELFARAAMLPGPAAGVVYGGIRGGGDEGKPSHRMGLAGELSAAIVVIWPCPAELGQVAADEFKGQAIDLLDTIRNGIKDTKGPTEKTWRFVSEGPVFEKKGLVVYVQRWAIPVTLT